MYFNAASIWEIEIKHDLHPYQMKIIGEEAARLCAKAGFYELPVRKEHVYLLPTLQRAVDAPPHKDPFDRILIAQAKGESMLFITHDSKMSQYEELCIKNV